VAAADTVTLGVDDACAGLETPDGRVFKVRDHLVELPEREANNFLTANRGAHLHKHRKVYVGWSPRREAAYDRIFGTNEEDERVSEEQ